jgi:hypothetical protein
VRLMKTRRALASLFNDIKVTNREKRGLVHVQPRESRPQIL